MPLENRVRIILHGYLKKLHPGEIFLSGRTAAEIMSGLLRMIPELKPRHDKGRQLVQVVGFNTEESFFCPLSQFTSEMHVVPAMTGGKGLGGIFRIVLGIVLIAVAIYFGPALGAIGGITLGGTSGVLFNFGVSLLLGGLLEMLSPAPGFGSGGKNPVGSLYLGAQQNTTRIGTRIPILYGKFKVFGQILSYNVDAKDVKV